MFVNGFGLPFWSGIIFFFVVLFIVFGYFIWYTHKRKLVLINTLLLCFISVVVGYSSYATCVIRSYANPSIDMNDPEDVFSLIGYLSREQYGENYVVSGPYYTAFTTKDQDGYSQTEGSVQWRRDKKTGTYVAAGHKMDLDFNSKYTTVFPRMYHSEENYIDGYRYWGDIKPNPEAPYDKISFVKNNLRFFFKYQMEYMYGRYFAWNFIGRQNDIQGLRGEFHQGNWMTGIPAVDKAIGDGPSDGLPIYMQANRARNKLFALPFILGLLGMYFQYKRNKRDFFVTFVFFFMTGLAIAIYLNMPSTQPRERDYAFVGSFYVFAIWIGLGVLFIYEKFLKRMPSPSAAIIAGGLTLVAVPAVMASQEWDDHDRSKRTASLDYGADYLNSCAHNAVLFTNGDNDTYPLWYAQEVEGIRDDIRIVNLSLFGTDWYINQMREPINHAPGLEFTLTPDQTVSWEYLQYNPVYNKNYLGGYSGFLDLKKVLGIIGSKDPATKFPYDGQQLPFLPTKKVRIMVNKQNVINSGLVQPGQDSLIADYMDVDLKKNTVFKSDMMVLDFIATNNFKVPVYFSITSGPDEYLSLGPYLQQEGLTYRLVPLKPKKNMPGIQEDGKRIATDIMYDNMMTKFKWGKLDVNNTYVDYVLMRESETMRDLFRILATQLMNEGKMDKAMLAADKCLAVVPERNVPYDYNLVAFTNVYFAGGAKDKARALFIKLADQFVHDMDYYSKLKPDLQAQVYRNIMMDMRYGLEDLMRIAEMNKQKDLVDKYTPKLNAYRTTFSYMMQGPPGDQDGE
jgi:hypothetical protein